MKSKLLTLLLIGVLMCGCTTDKDLPEGDRTGDKDKSESTMEIGETGYLSFKLSAPPSLSGRGEYLPDYEDGSTEENLINKVRLYFIDEDDKIVNVRHGDDTEGDYNGFYEWITSTEAGAQSGSRAGNVSKVESLTIKLNFENGHFPVKVLAVINPCADIDKESVNGLSDLMALSQDYLTDLTRGNFVMSNSTYLQTTSTGAETVCGVAIFRDNFQATPEDASDNPVEIYVERIVARIDYGFGNASDNLKPVAGKEYLFDTGITFTPIDKPGQTEKIYVKFLGWAVTSTTDASRLFKSLDATWTDTTFPGAGGDWNRPDYFRSFWAINPADVGYKWYTFNEISGDGNAGRDEHCHEMKETTAYMLENANPYQASGLIKASNPTQPTKVIFAARLVNEKEEALTVAEYLSKQYTLEGIMNLAASSLDMYTQDEDYDGDGSKYRKIKTSDLTFETASVHDNVSGPETQESYYVYFTLKDTAMQKTWYRKFDTEEEKDSKLITDIRKYLDDVLYPVKIWDQGNSYYYFDIPHFYGNTDDPGYYGVVRNHIYKATVTQLKSLGTPVYKPDEKIYPEHPATPGNQLEVIIKTLQWRMVSQSLQLAW